MVNMGGTSAAGAPDTAPAADETDAALAGDSPGGERDLLGEMCSHLGILRIPEIELRSSYWSFGILHRKLSSCLPSDLS